MCYANNQEDFSLASQIINIDYIRNKNNKNSPLSN